MLSRACARALVVAALAACSDPEAPSARGAARAIETVSPSTLTGTVGTALAEPLVVRVLDDQRRPVRGATVRFGVAEPLAVLTPLQAVTDASGLARTVVSLGTVAGRIEVIAQLGGSDSTARFAITAAPLTARRVDAFPAPMQLFGVAETGRLLGAVVDQHGNAIPAVTVSWQSLDASVATVSADGLVTAVQAGATARMEVRSPDGLADTVLVSVADPATPACSGATAITLAPGASVVLDPHAGTCIRNETSAEFVAVPFFASRAPRSRSGDLRVVGTGIRGASSAIVTPAPIAPRADARPLPDDAFEHALRRREARELAPLIAQARQAHEPADAVRNAIPAGAVVGDVVTINASPSHACSFPSDAERDRDMRTGRIVAITPKAIVVADERNPSGGFTQAEYRELGTIFDTLVAPVNEQAFGAVGDVDANGRVVIFYTARVNQISRGGTSYVGGFFWARDLLPTSVCGTSNVAEIFYMLVPDPNGEINGVRRTKEFVRQVTVGTLGHEHQHLINASRRIANPLAEPSEATWLNEGLSHIAEELLFYRSSGLQPRMNIGAAQFTGQVVDRYYDFQHNNTVRFEHWLARPDSTGPFDVTDSLATRGAAWAFLRYLADRRPADGDIWYRLVNNPRTGIGNVEEVFGVNILDAVRDWAIAMYVDDYAGNLPAAHQFASWNFRSLYPALPRGPYPIAYSELFNNSSRIRDLEAGSAWYFPFRTRAGDETRVWMRRTEGSPMPAVTVTIVRVR